MEKEDFSVIAMVATVALVGIMVVTHPSVTGMAVAPFADLAASGPVSRQEARWPPAAELPDAVREAIKNRQETVDVPVTRELSRTFFIDYSAPVHATPLGTDCGPDSASYKRMSRNLRWTSFPITYQIDASATPGVDSLTAQAAVLSSLATWDAEEHPAGALFMEASPPKLTISWAGIDGNGGTLAVTSVYYNRFTGAIISASVTYDAYDSWATYPGLGCSGQGTAFDIEDVGTHEVGHVLGLDHVRKSGDVALTMWPYASQGETYKRTLGIGDKKGVDAIY